MEELLRYHIKDTEKKFDSIVERLEVLDSKMDSLNEFKLQSITSSRLVSAVISSITGILTLVVTSIVSYVIAIKSK